MNYKSRAIKSIYNRLRSQYGNSHNYTIHSNPLDTLIFILLSVRTTEKVYSRLYTELKKEFSKWNLLMKVSVNKLARLIKNGGKQNIKARYLKAITKIITNKFGRLTLTPLSKRSNAECEEFLTALPGVGKKVARCVMLFSFGRKVFPVDSHCWRISKRIGLIRSNYKTPTDKEMDCLQNVIPPRYRHLLHLNMLTLGRKVCTSNNPKCVICPITKYCKKITV